MSKNILLLVVLVSSIMLVSSCKKSKEDKIVGIWEYVEVRDVETNNRTETWTFDSSKKLKIEILTPYDTTTYNGEYTITYKTLGTRGYFVNITEINGKEDLFDGIYRIKELKKDLLFLNRIEREVNGKLTEDGAFLWKEFIK